LEEIKVTAQNRKFRFKVIAEVEAVIGIRYMPNIRTYRDGSAEMKMIVSSLFKDRKTNGNPQKTSSGLSPVF
jgi:hypothetical protein